MKKNLTLKGAIAGIGAMIVTCSICWVLAFIAGVRPMNWLAGSELDANQSYLAMVVTVGLIGASLHGCWYSLFRKS